MLKILKASDLFVMPSPTGGPPIGLLEVTALARPIVGSRVDGIPDIVSHWKHALLVEPVTKSAWLTYWKGYAPAYGGLAAWARMRARESRVNSTCSADPRIKTSL